MKKLYLYLKLFSFALLCSVGIIQNMELENLSIENQKNQYGATSQGKPLKKMVCPEINKPFFRLFLQSLPTEMWEKIWEHLDCKDQLNLGSVAHSFEHMRQHVQLDVCQQTLCLVYNYYSNTDIWVEPRGHIYRFYACTKKVCIIRDTTKIDTIKTACEALLEDANIHAQNLIEYSEWLVARAPQCRRSENYEKVKYIKEIYDDLNAVDVYCVECDDEWRNTKYECYRDCCSSERVKFEKGLCCVICSPWICVCGILGLFLECVCGVKCY